MMRSTQRFEAAVALLLVMMAAGCKGGMNSPKSAAVESATIAQMRTINAAETAYFANHDHYACTMAELGSQFGLIDRDLSYGKKDGFFYDLKCASRDGVPTYQAWASPINTSITRSNYYCTDQTGTVRVSSGRIMDCKEGRPVN
jgi:type II secretory pathway pseudopilin PulG